MFDKTKEYIKENTGFVIPLSVIAGLAFLFVGWAYAANQDHEARIITVEVKQENMEEKIDKVDKTTQKIYDHLLSQ